MMWNVALSVYTVGIAGCVLWLRPLVTSFGTVALCCIAEVAVCLVRRCSIQMDPSLLVTGLIIALLMPVNAPFWMPALAALFAVLVVRAPFGGTGCTPSIQLQLAWRLSPSVGRNACFLISVPPPDGCYRLFGECTYTAVRSPAGVLKEGLKPDIVPWRCSKAALGPMGTTAMLVIGACGLFLILRRIANWEAPVFFLAGSGCGAALFQESHAAQLTSVKYELMSGSLFFALSLW